MIHGTNWDTHIEKALVFLKAKKPVLIDKPVVGSAGDAAGCWICRPNTARSSSAAPRCVMRGRSQRCATAVGPRKELLSVVAAGPGDFFSYGIHTTEMLQGLHWDRRPFRTGDRQHGARSSP